LAKIEGLEKLQQEGLPENSTKTRIGSLVVPCGETTQIFAVDCNFRTRLRRKVYTNESTKPHLL